MAYALLPQISTQINALFLSTSPASSSFGQPSHTLKLREDLKALQRMVRRIQAVLADAERREIHDESVKLWLRELSCLAYDADDVLDEYNYQVLRAQVEASIQSDGGSRPPPRKLKHHQEKVSILTMASSSSDGSTWNKLADRMGKIRLRFEEISRDREALHLREGAVRERQNAAVRPPSSHLPDTPTIFGREKIMEEVISMLLSLADGSGEKRSLSVLPIVGMGGVGKTTLVQHVYNDQRVCGRFPSRAWVCVSDDFAVDSLTKRIIESLTEEACQLNEFDAMQRTLMQLLKKGERCLVVLDDVWNETPSFWDCLLKPFRLAGVEGSAAIVTTRIESIARMVQTMPFRPLDCLSDDTCWLMFKQDAFLDRDPADHMDLVQIGEKIVNKCRGLPLAVKVLASLLRCEFDRDRWEEILQGEVWNVPDQHDEIIPALRLSYHHLPSHLKPCFLYASVFPKDYQFHKEQLVQLWMAQGFLQCEGRKQVEDVGNEYFDDLTKRSLFSPCNVGWNGEHNCVLHDLIHDLARDISEGEITSCVGKEEDGEDKLFPVGGSELVRHLYTSHHQGSEGIEGMLQSLCSDDTLVIRSLLVLSKGQPDDNDVELKLLNEMMLNLESLRVLDFSNFGKMSELPDSMGYLRHLRYLKFERNKGLRGLPGTIGMLYNLQVLHLKHCHNLKSLPESIGGLCNLRYLNLNDCYFMESLPESIRGLCNLRDLHMYACWKIKCLPESIGGLCNLRDLNLNACENLLSLPKSIGGLCNLRDLNLRDCKNLRSLPESIQGLCNLRDLNLTACRSLMSLPESLGGLCNLRDLNLNDCWFMESLPESIGGLCNLQNLYLKDCRNLMSLPESIGGLCNLQYLGIEGICNLSYPRGMNRLTNLRSLFGFTVPRRRSGDGEVHGMELLKDMVHLRGSLKIEDLAIVVNPEDAVTANLRNKKHIRWLWLDWGWRNGDNGNDNEKAYRVLENLRPPNGLEDLQIDRYRGIRFPSWMGGDASYFSQLTRVELSYCIRCTLLPPLGQLPSLTRLEIQEAWDLERVGPEFRGVGFPALEVLHFKRMPSWVTWDAAERGDFPRLRQLHVYDCSKLQSMVPVYLFPALQELKIEVCSSLPSIELKMPSSSSSSIGPPPLVSMTISKCPFACFSPEDDPLLLPATLQYVSIDSRCPLLLEWCRKDDGRRRLAHIPRVDIPELEIE